MNRTPFVFILFLTMSIAAKAETIVLTSLEWPPYASESLDSNGASVAVATAAFNAMGHTLVVEFYPWSRAVSLPRDGGRYIGYFPEYYFETEHFVFSDAMGEGPLGFVENKTNPVEWATLDDLRQYQLGIVQDYINTEALDNMIASGQIEYQSVVSDAQNILKVAAQRIDLAVIDPNVLAYLLQNEPRVARAKGSVQMNEKLLVNKELFIAFRNDETGKRWQEIFNEGLTKINVEIIMNQFLEP